MSDTGAMLERSLGPRRHAAYAAGGVLFCAALVGLAALEPKAILLTAMGAAALFFAIIAWRDPWLGLMGFLGYSAVHMYLRAFVPTMLYNVMMLGLVGIAGLGILARRPIRERFLALDAPYVALVGIYAIYVATSSGEFSTRSIYGLRDAVQFLLMSFLVPLFTGSERQLRRMVDFLLLLGLGIAAGALLGYVLGPASGLARLYVGIGPAAGKPEVRVVSTLGEPNILGAGMAMLLLLALPRLGPLRLVLKRWPYYGLVLLYAGALLLSGSRGALAILCVAVAVTMVGGSAGVIGHLYALARARMPRGTLAALVVGPLLAGGLLVLGGQQTRALSALARLSFTSLNAQQSLGTRLMLWRTLLASQPNLLFGLGAGGYTRAGAQLNVFQVVDSYYIKLLVEQGIVGAALFGALLTYVFVRAIRFHWRTREWRPISWSVVGTLVLVGGLSLPYTTLDMFPLNAWFWSMVGVLLCMMRFERQAQASAVPAAGEERQAILAVSQSSSSA